MPAYATMRLIIVGGALLLPVYLSADDDPARLNAAADSLAARGSWEEARRSYLEVYASLKNTLGPEDPRTVRALANVCDASVPLAARLNSLAVCTRALELRKKVQGSDSADTAKSMSDLALLYAAEGDLARAGKLIERALRIDGAGVDSPEFAGLMNNLGYLYFKKKKYALSRDLFARAVATAEITQDKTRGTTHGTTPDGSDMFTMLTNLGVAELAVHDPRSAAIHFRRALRIAEESFGSGHVKCLNARSNLARAEAAMGNVGGTVTNAMR